MSESPRVLHVSLTDGWGGADIAALRIVRATQLAGVQSQFIVRESVQHDSEVLEYPISSMRRSSARASSWLASRIQKSSNPFHRSLNLVPTGGIPIEIPIPDIYHLHWIGSNALSLSEVQNLRAPVVWTLHDSWPFSGAEHHPLYPHDQRFRDGYRRTNRGQSSRVDVDRFVWRLKKRAWRRDFTLIAPSSWMQQQAQASDLMRGQRILVVPNPIPTDVFTPEGPDLRSHLGIPEDRLIVLFAGFGGARFEHKGWSSFGHALTRLFDQGLPVHVLLAGATARPPGLPSRVPFTGMGHVSSDASMASVYRSCDLFVTTSTIESFGMTAAEASSCGIPVVCSGETGLADVVVPGETGWWFSTSQEESLSEALMEAINDPLERLRRGLNGRSRAEARWSLQSVGSTYAQVYRSLLEDT